jgi:anaerobic selenocysteine-containing dehydrogenase
MKFTRRNFLAWAGISAVGAVGCDIFGKNGAELRVQSPVMQPEDLVKGRDNWYATLCRQCPTSEGVLVRVMEGRAKKVQGNPGYPVNRGKQSARCDAGLQALYHPERLTGPMRRTGARGSGGFTPINWEQGLNTLNAELGARGDGLLLITEPMRAHPALIAGRFAGAFGGRHLGFEALDQATYRAAVKSVYGQDLLPDFDLANANFLLSFGADFLSTWVSPTRWSVGYGDFRQGEGRTQRGTHVQVEPRFSLTAANADRWVPIKPGVEGYLALSLAQVIISENLQAGSADVSALTGGQGAGALANFSPDQVGPMLELPEAMLQGHSPADWIRELARDFAGHPPALAIGGDSAAAYSNGLFNLEAVYALNYLVGSVGEIGGVRFNPVSPIADLPASAATGTLADWTGAAGDIREGRTRLLMVHTADPVYGLPSSVGFADALNRDDLFIVSFSPFMDETTAMADLILPDRVYLEDWGSDIPEPAPGYQVLGIQQPVVNPLSDLDPRSFFDVLLSTAQELGRDGDLPWGSLQEALRETSDALFALNRGSVEATSADEFWNHLLRQGGWWDQRETGPSPGAPDGIYRQIASRAAPPSFSGEGSEFYLLPFSHNTLLDGRNTHLPWAQAAPDPITTVTWQTWAEMNPRRMEEMGLREGDIVQVQSSQGNITAPVYPNPAMRPDVVGVPLGQGRRHGPEYATSGDPRASSNVLSILAASQIEGTGTLAWAANRVQVSATGESMRVAKFEGEFTSREIGNQIDNNPGEEIIRTTTPGGEH